MKRKKQQPSNLGLAVLFCFLVFGLILISLIFKTLILFEKSKFNGSNTISILFNEKNNEQIVYFSPQTPSISILTLKGYDQNVGRALEIPIDGRAYSEKSLNGNNLSSQLLSSVFNFKNQKDINIVDYLKLYFFTKSTNKNLITEKNFSSDSNPRDISSLISTVFVDPMLSGEKQNIEVINATDVYGLGNRLANLISNMGGNVILVTTQDPADKSQIEYVKKSYTAKRLNQLLGFDLVRTEKKSIPDVIITIGKDSLSNLKF